MKQYIVEETVIREMPEMAEPATIDYIDFNGYFTALCKYDNAISTMPTYPRGDNGKWKVGQIINEGVDFEFGTPHYRYGSIGIAAIPIQPELKMGVNESATIAIPIEPEPKKDVDESALRELIIVVNERSTCPPLSWPDLLKQLEGKFIIQYKK